MIIETANALGQNSSILWPTMEFWDFVLLVISLFILASWVFSIVFILWWGLLLILSWWKEDKIKPAINTIRFSVIGIIVTVLTIFVFPILGRLLWLDVQKYANPTAIFTKIETLWNKIFWKTNSSQAIPTWSNQQNLDNLPTNFSDL